MAKLYINSFLCPIAPPTITIDPISSQHLSVGQTLSLSCVAIGVPTPIIAWTWDGGDLPGYVQMTSSNGVGKLTIHNASESNSGRYSCYAINKVAVGNVVSPSAAVVITGNINQRNKINRI